MARGKIKLRGHVGAIVEGTELRSDTCCGSDGADAVQQFIQGYKLIDAGDGGMYMEICRKCAVKMALQILELEVV